MTKKPILPRLPYIMRILFVLLLLPFTSAAQLRVSSLFSDHSVLQRDHPIEIRGEAKPHEKITVTLANQRIRTKADVNGLWLAELRSMKAGGPWTLTVTGQCDTLVRRDILIGDVWLCSGQSNMEFKVSGTRDAENEIAQADYPAIRAFNLPRVFSYKKQHDADAVWEICSPASVGHFSAVAYFFARKIHQQTGVPVGIVNASWGGTIIETWTSPEGYNALPHKFIRRYCPGDSLESPAIHFAPNEAIRPCYEKAVANDPGLHDEWYRPDTDITEWKPIKVPQSWNLNELARIDGVVWMRREITLPESVAGVQARISLGTIGDEDIVWINGRKVGSTAGKYVPRDYFIEPGILRPGKNVITIRITDYTSDGGINSSAEIVYLKAGNGKYPLAGKWNYRIAVSNKDFGYINVSRNSYPSLTYNAMIHPLTGFAIRGTIWYQGENNTGNASAYSILLPNLIRDWRTKWGYDFPFYIIQLPNWHPQDLKPNPNSQWAAFREAQTSALALPATDIVVTADLGEAGNIHPRNKQDVGLRTALVVLRSTYGRNDITASGPVFRDAEFSGSNVTLHFTETGSGLMTTDKYGYLRGFMIAGEDRRFVWAQARIEDDRVIVHAEGIHAPVAVRYNWADNPDGTLYNREGFPARPFRTDNW